MIAWEEIVALAGRIHRSKPGADAGELSRLLAAHVLDFDAAVRAGATGLPESWKPVAVHLAGYGWNVAAPDREVLRALVELVANPAAKGGGLAAVGTLRDWFQAHPHVTSEDVLGCLDDLTARIDGVREDLINGAPNKEERAALALLLEALARASGEVAKVRRRPARGVRAL